jgi:hypothetical protein
MILLSLFRPIQRSNGRKWCEIESETVQKRVGNGSEIVEKQCKKFSLPAFQTFIASSKTPFFKAFRRFSKEKRRNQTGLEHMFQSQKYPIMTFDRWPKRAFTVHAIVSTWMLLDCAAQP